jgi:thiamine-phosphate pyrophosphorylase
MNAPPPHPHATSFGIYAIVDLPYPYPLALEEVVHALAKGGVRHMQVRAKAFDTAQRIAALRKIAPICERFAVPLWVNDDVQAALAPIEGIAGVHLGQGDWETLDRTGVDELARVGRGFGLSTHNLAQVEAAKQLRPDYIGFGPVFRTTSKINPEPTTGVEELRAACEGAQMPVVAIGGITPSQFVEVACSGAQYVAMISALCAPSGIEIETRARTTVEEWRKLRINK